MHSLIQFLMEDEAAADVRDFFIEQYGDHCSEHFFHRHMRAFGWDNWEQQRASILTDLVRWQGRAPWVADASFAKILGGTSRVVDDLVYLS